MKDLCQSQIINYYLKGKGMEVLPYTLTFMPLPQHLTQTTQFTLLYKIKLQPSLSFVPFFFRETFSEERKCIMNSFLIPKSFLAGKCFDFVFLLLESTLSTGIVIVTGIVVNFTFPMFVFVPWIID